MLSKEIIIQTDGFGNKKQRYIKKQRIGTGGFAKCYLLVNIRTEQKFAAKVIDSAYISDKSARLKVMQQIQIHRQLSHKNIVQFHTTFQFQSQIYILMELCQNNTLKQFVRNRVRIIEFQAKCYLKQILDGIQYLHGYRILHRDIKLGNLFLNMKMEVKIGDFGLSRFIKSQNQRRYTTCGTPNYIAPQILKETGHSYQADIWAIGIILYTMLIGKPPFESQSVETTYKKIKSNSYEFPKQIPISNEAKSLIKSILDPNPKTRFTLQQIRKHEFLTKDCQNIPPTMPAYTISIPPQANFLKQYINDKTMKLSVYPKKVNDRKTALSLDDDKISKLDRVVSADKKMLLKMQSIRMENKEISSLNRGRYLKMLRVQSLPKQTLKNGKGIRSSASIGASTPRNTKKIQTPISNALSPQKSHEDINEIICYYDISDKFGIAYLLSNGNYGIIFNDRTSMTALADPNSTEITNSKESIVYYDKTAQFLDKIPQNLVKKSEILKICKQKLQHYRKNNILISYYSQTYGKKYIKFSTGFVIKLSNGLMQFFWGADSITLRNYKWVKWRIEGVEGECKINQKNLSLVVQYKIEQIKQFLLKYCHNSKADAS